MHAVPDAMARQVAARLGVPLELIPGWVPPQRRSAARNIACEDTRIMAIAPWARALHEVFQCCWSATNQRAIARCTAYVGLPRRCTVSTGLEFTCVVAPMLTHKVIVCWYTP
jgi:hypothetical protein